MVAINTFPYIALEDWKDFWKSKDADDVTWATDTEGELVRQYQVYSLGTTVIINREGRISYRDDGATPYEVLLAEVKEVL